MRNPTLAYLESFLGKDCYIVKTNGKKAFCVPTRVRKLEGRPTIFYERKAYKGIFGCAKINEIKMIREVSSGR